MNEQIFNDKNGLSLKVRKRAKAIEFFLASINDTDLHFNFFFTEEVFHDLISYIMSMANKTWDALTPREAMSCASDYDEYYDRKLDNNGYFSFSEKNYSIHITRPTISNLKMYQFNRRKMESLMFDINRCMPERIYVK